MDKDTENCQLSPVNYQLPSPPAEAHYTVYKLTDPEGKIYIGCTGQSVKVRWGNGCNYHRGTPIREAIIRIGWANFEKKLLCEKLTREGAEKLEKWFIAFYDSANPEKGYNRTLGGLGKGFRMSEDTRALCSRNAKKRFAEDPSCREKVRKCTLEAYKNPEYVRKLSEIKKRFFAEHPEKRAEKSRQMKAFFSRPENRCIFGPSTRPKPVICVETGEMYPSQRAAEKTTGFKSIHLVCSGRLLTSGGFHWRYAENYSQADIFTQR